MRKKAGIISFFTVSLSVIAFFIRRLQLEVLFEPETGLPISGLHHSKIMLFVTAIFVLELLFLTLRLRNRESGADYRTALRGKTIAFPTISSVAGVIMIAGAIPLFTSAGNTDMPILYYLLAILAIASGGSFPIMAMGPKKDSSGMTLCVFSAIPVLLYCYWLVITYKENSADPVLWNYAFNVLAIASGTLGFYYVAGYAFEKIRPTASIFFANLTVFFAAVSVAGNMANHYKMLSISGALMLLVISFVLVDNLGEKITKEEVETENSDTSTEEDEIPDEAADENESI